jgi:FMN phosphatase YigB (HAD superfamily)
MRVLFDVGGTLLGKPGLVPAIRSVLHDHGVDVDENVIARRHKLVSEITEFPDRTSREFYERFNRSVLIALGVPADPRLVTDLFERCAALEWRAFEDVERLAVLDRPLDLVANWHSGLASEAASLLPLPVGRVVTSESEGVRKPDPELLLRALRQIGCPPSGAVYVGDSVALDMAPAAALHLPAVLVDRLDLFPAFPGQRVRSLDELPSLLTALDGSD